MPNFDGTGLLKRGRIIGREMQPFKKCCEDHADHPVKEESPL
jgi:hypothetical protein